MKYRDFSKFNINIFRHGDRESRRSYRRDDGVRGEIETPKFKVGFVLVMTSDFYDGNHGKLLIMDIEEEDYRMRSLQKPLRRGVVCCEMIWRFESRKGVAVAGFERERERE